MVLHCPVGCSPLLWGILLVHAALCDRQKSTGPASMELVHWIGLVPRSCSLSSRSGLVLRLCSCASIGCGSSCAILSRILQSCSLRHLRMPSVTAKCVPQLRFGASEQLPLRTAQLRKLSVPLHSSQRESAQSALLLLPSSASPSSEQGGRVLLLPPSAPPLRRVLPLLSSRPSKRMLLLLRK